jgi:hypothetical protein
LSHDAAQQNLSEDFAANLRKISMQNLPRCKKRKEKKRKEKGSNRIGCRGMRELRSNKIGCRGFEKDMVIDNCKTLIYSFHCFNIGILL